MDEKKELEPKQRYTWPWFVLAAVLLGVVLAIFWMSVLVRRTREQREMNMWQPTAQPTLQTNSSPTNGKHP